MYVKPSLSLLHITCKRLTFQVFFFLIQRPNKGKDVISFLSKRKFYYEVIIPHIMTQSPWRRGGAVLQGRVYILWKFICLKFPTIIIWTMEMQLLCSNKGLLYWMLTCSLLWGMLLLLLCIIVWWSLWHMKAQWHICKAFDYSTVCNCT